MATLRKSIINHTFRPELGVAVDLVANQITEATLPSVGGVLCYVFSDAGADIGFYGSFKMSKNFVSAPKAVVTVILDGAPGAADTLGFGFRKRAVANNESSDGTFDAEEVATATIGSNSLNYADEDMLEMSITLTAADYAIDDLVHFYCYVDTSGTTYAGNLLLQSIEIEYADA
jgi:hypothetical protein